MRSLLALSIGFVAICNIVFAGSATTTSDRQLLCVESIAKQAEKSDHRLRGHYARMSKMSNGVVRAQLAMMSKTDQTARKYLLRTVSECGVGFDSQSLKSIGSLVRSIDRKNLAELKTILEKIQWPVISKYGAVADQAAFLVVQHADDDAQFQSDVLHALRPLVQRRETSSENYALLYDRVQTNSGRLQLYGSQGECLGHKWMPDAIEDPLGVDKRRVAIGLPNMSTYSRRAAKLICGAS